MYNEVDHFDWEEPYSIVDKSQEEKKIDFLIGIVEASYDTGCVEEFSHCLEELCALFDIKLPANNLLIALPRVSKTSANKKRKGGLK